MKENKLWMKHQRPTEQIKISVCEMKVRDGESSGDTYDMGRGFRN